jgi:hypothetical protein
MKITESEWTILACGTLGLAAAVLRKVAQGEQVDVGQIDTAITYIQNVVNKHPDALLYSRRVVDLPPRGSHSR